MKTEKEKLAEATFESVEEMMVAYAAEAVRIARVNHRVRLDYSPGSVAELEAILVEQAPVDLDYQVKTWGAYFGEVLRKRWGGDWSFTQYPNAVAAVPTLEIMGSRLYPLMKVYRRLTIEQGENLMDFLIMVAERLDKATPVLEA